MSSFVLDNSISAAWCFQDQSTDYTEAVLGSLIAGTEAIVPAIWKLELANALVVAERRKKIAPEKSARFLRDLQQFAISMDLDGLEYVFATVLEYARLYHRSVYDASYLELAQRRSLPLATKDEPLLQAAKTLGISAFQP